MNPLLDGAQALQYGAMGLLFLVLFGVWRLLSPIAKRVAAAFDKLSETLDRILVHLELEGDRARRRHNVVKRRLERMNGRVPHELEDEEDEEEGTHGS